jgi:LmbE family N-acetylglucosaminyl deacetylase
MNKSKRIKDIKILFFTPHADDIELGVPFMYLEALRLGNEVVEVLMTNNEYGTKDGNFKGNRLRRIREFELCKANKVFEQNTSNQIKVIRLNYVDGHLPLNHDSLEKVMHLINKERPTIIFAPDPWFAQDFHIDHLNTGRLVYFSLKKLNQEALPKRVFYYYSTKTHFYLKCNWKDFKIVERALRKHKSQYSAMESKLIMVFYNRLSILRHFLETFGFSESFREQQFQDGTPVTPSTFEEMSFRERIIYYLFSSTTIWGSLKFFDMPPEEVGIYLNYNTRDHLKSIDHRYQYVFEANREKH